MDETSELHKTVNQLKRSRKLIAAMDLLPNATFENTAQMARLMTDEQWEGLALLADIKPPSKETIRLVKEALDERVRIQRKMKASPAYLALHG